MRAACRLASIGVGFGVLLWSAGATAQVERISEAEQGYEVAFEDGNVLGSQLNAMGDRVMLRTAPRRVLLIRARTSFVPELTKTVEQM